MIEKLQKHEIIRHGVVIEKQGCEPREIIDKINELVDAVNGILAAQEQYATIYKEDIVPMLTPKNEEPAENVQDNFAEQRKWVGKLCRFWDEDDKNYFVFGILGEIDKDKQISRRRVIYFDSENSGWWEHCEPVKPEDPIVYKGE